MEELVYSWRIRTDNYKEELLKGLKTLCYVFGYGILLANTFMYFKIEWISHSKDNRQNNYMTYCTSDATYDCRYILIIFSLLGYLYDIIRNCMPKPYTSIKGLIITTMILLYVIDDKFYTPFCPMYSLGLSSSFLIDKTSYIEVIGLFVFVSLSAIGPHVEDALLCNDIYISYMIRYHWEILLFVGYVVVPKCITLPRVFDSESAEKMSCTIVFVLFNTLNILLLMYVFIIFVVSIQTTKETDKWISGSYPIDDPLGYHRIFTVVSWLYLVPLLAFQYFEDYNFEYEFDDDAFRASLV